jgi:hypothetical protein
MVGTAPACTSDSAFTLCNISFLTAAAVRPRAKPCWPQVSENIQPCKHHYTDLPGARQEYACAIHQQKTYLQAGASACAAASLWTQIGLAASN